MFKTEHLEGRLLYETDKVVCINVFINSNYTDEDNVFLFQVLASLKNEIYNYFRGSFSYNKGLTSFTLSKNDIDYELKEGMQQYFQIRKDLGLVE